MQAAEHMARRPLNGVFVAGSGTDVGKTVVTAALLRALLRAGVRVQAVKPVQTGVAPDQAHMAPLADERVYAAAFFAGGLARSGARQPVFGQADSGLKAVLYGQLKEFIAGALRGQAEQHFFAFVAPLVYG